MSFRQRFEERVEKREPGQTGPGFVQRFEQRVKYGSGELSQTARDTAARYQKVFSDSGYDWKNGLEYDEWDEEDQNRKAAGQLPKAIESAYDMDDPVDRYLYENGMPPKKKIASYAKEAEKYAEESAESAFEERRAQAAAGAAPVETPVQNTAETPIEPYALPSAEIKPLPVKDGETLSTGVTVQKAANSLPSVRRASGTGVYEYKTLGDGSVMPVEMTQSDILREKKAREQAVTWQAAQEEWAKEYAEKYAGLSQNADWEGRVRKGAAMELPKELMRSNVSAVESAKKNSYNPYESTAEAYAGNDKYWDYFTQDERNVYNYLRAEDEAAAQEYYAFMLDQLEMRRTQKEAKRARELAVEDPFAAQVVSVGVNVPAAAKSAGYTLKQAITGEQINPYANAYSLGQVQSAIREETKENIDSSTLRFLYDVGMSTADFLSLLPLGEAGSLAVMGAKSFGETARDAVERGATTEEALALGAVTAAAETLTEKIGIERLLGQIGSGSAGTLKSILKEAARSTFGEGAEEMLSGAVASLADWLIMQDKSQFAQTFNAALAETGDPAQAFAEVAKGFGAELLLAGAGGALSGLAMSGGALSVSNIAHNIRTGRQIKADGTTQSVLADAHAMGTLSDRQYQKALSRTPSALRLGAIDTETTDRIVREFENANSQTSADLPETLPNAEPEALPTVEPQALPQVGAQEAEQKLQTMESRRAEYEEAERIAGRETALDQLASSTDPAISKRAETFKRRYERQFIDEMAGVFSLPPTAKRELRAELDGIAASIIETGRLSEETKRTLFDEMIQKGVIKNTEFLAQHEDAARWIKDLRISPAGIESDAKKAVFGTIPVAKDGVKMDVAYQELNGMWPDLFPEDITNPSDQLRQLYEIKKAFKGTEETLAKHFGDDYAEFEQESYEAFDAALYDLRKKLGLIDRYETSRRTRMEEKKTREAFAEDYHVVEQALADQVALEREADRVRAANLLTADDRREVDYMLKGGTPDLSGHSNRQAILNVYEAEKAVQDNEAIIQAAGKLRVEKRKNSLRYLLENSDKWKNKSSLALNTETAARNFEDIAGEDGAQIVQTLIEPIGRNVAERIRWQMRWAKRIADLKLNHEESALVQLMGENRIPAEELRDGITFENGKPVDVDRIANAVKVFREFYDEALDMANQALIRNGYKAVPKRQDYFPHIGEEVSDLDMFIEQLTKGREDALPTEIAGRTEWFTPGKKWFANFNERVGDATANDAVRGFNNYLRGVGDVIFLTDNIQDLRTFETLIREKYGMPQSEESTMSAKEHASHLSSLVMWLKEYTNLLAGKTPTLDRGIENLLGRRGLKLGDKLKNLLGANAVAGNLSTALSNFIPLTQGIATMPTQDFLYGVQSSLRNLVNNDGLWERSDFLTRRFGTVKDIQTKDWKKFQGKMQDVGSFPFEMADRVVAESLVRGKYHENLRKGMDDQEALTAADEYAQKIMADRSTGQQPVAFKTRVLGAFTQFQLEVKNQFSNILKDIPRWNDKNLAKIAWAYAKMAIAGCLWNELAEKLTGRRPALDPIDAGLEFFGDLKDDAGEWQIGTALVNLGENALEAVPFGSMIGEGGRVPLAGAIEDLNPIKPIKMTLDGEEGAGEAWKKLAISAAVNFAPTTSFLPVGAGQIKKTIEGISTVAKGGSYSGKEGEEKLRFYTDQTAGDYIKAGLFGQYALPEAQKYVENNFKTLSVKETEVFDAARESGMEPEKIMDLIAELKTLKPDKDKNGKTVVEKAYKQRKMLLEDDSLTEEQKTLFDKMFISASDRKGTTDFSDPALFELSLISDTGYEKALKAQQEGMPPELYLDLYLKRKEIDKQEGKASEKAALFDEYIKSVTDDEYIRYLANDYFGFYTQVRAQPKALPDVQIIGLPNAGG